MCIRWFHSTTGTQYEVDFSAVKSSSGFIPTTYQVAYSTSSLLSIGFSKGTSGGTVASPGNAYMQTQWLSGSMAQAPKLFVGIRPVMNIRGLVNATPVQIYTEAESGLQTGDTVTVASVGGTTSANGNWTVSGDSWEILCDWRRHAHGMLFARPTSALRPLPVRMG